MKTKLYTFQDLSDAIKNYDIQKSAVDRLQSEVNVDKGKIQQKELELDKANFSLSKEEQKILDIIGDLEIEFKQRRKQ